MRAPEVIVVGMAGPIGTPGVSPVLSGISSTSMTIGTGTKVFTTQSGLALTVGDYVTIANTASNWMVGQITAYAGTSMTVNVSRTGGSGTYAAWTINIAGIPGLQGTIGNTGPAPTISGTSTTSLAIGTGTKVFTTQSGLALTVGQFIIAASSASPGNFMIGQITAYSGTSLTLSVTTIGGSGTFASWNLALTTQPGGVSSVSDTASIDLTLSGGLLSAAAIFGTSAGTILQGNHAPAIGQHGDVGMALVTSQVTPANGTALQTIPDLTFSFGANETWVFSAFLILYVSTGTLGVKFRPVLSSTPAAFKVFFNGPTTGYTVPDVTKVTTNNTDTTKALGAFTHNGVDNSYVRIDGRITNGGSAGTFTLQYANLNSTGGSQVYVEDGSSMIAKRSS